MLSSAVLAESDRLPHAATAELITKNLTPNNIQEGQRIELSLSDPVNLRGERMFIPVDSIIVGHIIDTNVFDAQFKTIHFPNGFILYINANLIDPHPVINEIPDVKDETKLQKLNSWLIKKPYNFTKKAIKRKKITEPDPVTALTQGTEFQIQINSINHVSPEHQYDTQGEIYEITQ